MCRYRIVAIAGLVALSAAVRGFANEPPTHPVKEIPQSQLRLTTRMAPVPSLSGDGYATISYVQPRGDSLYLTCVDSPRAADRPKTERGPAYLVEMRLSRVK